MLNSYKKLPKCFQSDYTILPPANIMIFTLHDCQFFFFNHDNICVVVFCMQGCVLSCFSHVRLCAALWTAACLASLSMQFSRQEYWSGLPSPLQEIFLTQGLNLCLLCLPALATGFFTTSATWETQWNLTRTLICISIKE